MSNEPFDPTHEYGHIASPALPIEAYEIMARAVLPEGTPFKVLDCPAHRARAWFYSPDRLRVPNADRVRVLKECVA